MFCQERDDINYRYRSFIDIYATAISRYEFEDQKTSEWYWPVVYPLRFANYFAEIPRLPKPRLYSYQIRLEVQYQANRLIRECLSALGRIDARFARVQQMQKTQLLNLPIQEALQAIEVFQTNMRTRLEKEKKKTN